MMRLRACAGVILSLFFGSSAYANQAAVLDYFERSCSVCHGQYLAEGEVDWQKILDNRDSIISRTNPDLQGRGRMPPQRVGGPMQLSDQERAIIFETLSAVEGDIQRNPTALPLEEITLPEGFVIDVYAVAPGARSMAMAPDGTLFIGTGGFSNPLDRVYAAVDHDGDGFAEDVRVIVDGLDNPNGVAYMDGDLYVAERHRILRFADVLSSTQAVSQVVFEGFPDQDQHDWKVLRVGPDGQLYVPVGAPCNVCDMDAQPQSRGKFSRIFRLSPNMQALEEVAAGVRNTVGFDWHPQTSELWFTDNGRDMLGDNFPSDELNRVHTEGQHFGFPYCHGDNIPDPRFGRNGCMGAQQPAMALGPHVAALGMRFYTGSAFPARYQSQVFIAEHGSWNRSEPIGYRVTQVGISADGRHATEYRVFAEGWLRPNGRRWGRPVDVENAPDGSLYVSDDMAGVVYRIRYAL